jgi:hypothetical protein
MDFRQCNNDNEFVALSIFVLIVGVLTLIYILGS